MEWKDITVKQYERLCEIYEGDRENFCDLAIEYLFGIKDAEHTLSVTEYAKHINALSFFTKEIPANPPKTEYTLNGTRYTANLVPSALTAAQVQDLTQMGKDGSPLSDVLSVILVPEGMTYNYGYDLAKAKSDIGSLPVCDGVGLSAFFLTYLKRFIRIFQSSLSRTLLKEIPTETMERMQNWLDATAKALEMATD